MVSETGDLQTGRIDPAKVDIAKKGPRRRRKRNRPDPAPELKDWAIGAEKRAKARPHPPNILLEPAGLDQERWTSPHSDVDVWMLQLAEAFGTRSQSVISTFLNQIEALCAGKFWDDEAKQWRINEHEFSAVLAFVNSAKPRNEMEAALAAQMVAVHLLTMNVAARALKYDSDTRTAVAAGKLARTFAVQIEALRSLRGGKRATRQSIKVSRETHHHQHIHVHRGEEENGGQPHGRHETVVDQCTALPGPEPRRQTVPLPRRKGKGKV